METTSKDIQHIKDTIPEPRTVQEVVLINNLEILLNYIEELKKELKISNDAFIESDLENVKLSKEIKELKLKINNDII